MFKSEIQRNRFYVTKDNRIVLPSFWDKKKREWWVKASRRGGGGACKSKDIVREIAPDEALQMMEYARWGVVPNLLHWKKIAAEVGVNMILPWEPLPKDYVPEKKKRRKDKLGELLRQWL